MEIKSPSNNSSEKKNNKMNKSDKKSKLCYKFKIMDNNPKLSNYIGKYYLINLNPSLKKNFSVQKNKINLKNLPQINLKKSNNFSNSISISKSNKFFDNKKYKFSEDSESKIVPKIYVSLSTKKYNNISNDKYTHKNLVALTESNEDSNLNKKYSNEEIMKKINERYFVRKSTMKYLSDLFYGEKDLHDLRMINLKKIKDKNQNEIFNYKNKRLQDTYNIFKYNRDSNKKTRNNYKINSFYDKSKEKPNELYKLNYDDIRDLKIKKNKYLVDNAVNRLMKTRKKSDLYFENFRKTCDFKYEDLDFMKYSY